MPFNRYHTICLQVSSAASGVRTCRSGEKFIHICVSCNEVLPSEYARNTGMGLNKINVFVHMYGYIRVNSV